jgi:hypothetical protein
MAIVHFETKLFPESVKVLRSLLEVAGTRSLGTIGEWMRKTPLIYRPLLKSPSEDLCRSEGDVCKHVRAVAATRSSQGYVLSPSSSHASGLRDPCLRTKAGEVFRQQAGAVRTTPLGLKSLCRGLDVPCIASHAWEMRHRVLRPRPTAEQRGELRGLSGLYFAIQRKIDKATACLRCALQDVVSAEDLRPASCHQDERCVVCE